MTPQNLLHDLMPEAVWQALGYTLLHSLWQGTLIALVLAALLALMHQHTAATRYRVAWAGLMAMLVLSTLTFYQVYEAPATVSFEELEATTLVLQQDNQILNPETSLGLWENAWAQGQVYFNQHLPAVVLIWLLGMLVMGLRMLGGWVYAQRLKSYRTQLVPQVWQQRAQQISRQLGIKTAVAVAESALVQVPVVIGHFKPIILLPLGALAGLAAAQIEAVLAHELSHVYRRDYLLNLLQSVVETVFFFHPAVWWISDCIRTEREHASDDLALSVCSDSLTYAYALTTLEELMMKKPPVAPRLSMAFSGRRRSLLGRITRLVQKPDVHPSFAEGFLASCAVMAGILVFSISAWANSDVNARVPAYAFDAAYQEHNFPVQDYLTTEDMESVPSAEEEETYTLQTLDNGLIIVQNKKGKVIEVYVNGRRIPKSELGQYQERIEQQLAAAKQGKTLRNRQKVEEALALADASLENLQSDEENYLVPPAPIPPAPLAPPAPMAPLAPAPRAHRVPRPAPVPPVAPIAPRSDDKASSDRYEAAMEQYRARLEDYETRVQAYAAEREAYAARREATNFSHQERLQDHSRRTAEHAVRMKEHEKRLAGHAIRMKEHEKRMADHKVRMEKHDAVMRELKAELVKDGLIESEDAQFDFRINKNGLFFNDQKQSDKLFEKYKKLISKTSGDDMEIEMRKEGTTYTISTKD